MIWGEFVTQIRNLHSELLDQHSIQPQQFLIDLELATEGFPFPVSSDDYGEWNPPLFPEKIQEALEFHPVERVLLEGPLLPIQEVVIPSEAWEHLFQAIFNLEKEWLQKSGLFSPERLTFVEQNLRAKFIQLQRRSGRFGLKVV